MKRVPNRGRLLAGYTIVEVTLFLAISGGILVASSALLSGRQERVRFTQTIDTLEDQLRDVLNDTSTGFFPSNNDFSCSERNGPGGTTVPDIRTSNPEEQGSNTGCVFVGKLVNFINNSAGPKAFNGTYTTYTIVATKDVTADTLNASRIPFKLLGSNSPSQGLAPGIAESREIFGGVVLTKRLIDVADGLPFDSLAVISDFGDQSGVGFSGNAGRVKIYGYNGQPYHDNNGLVDNGGSGPILKEITGPLVLCINQDNENGRAGAVIINPQLTIDRMIDEQPSECEQPKYNI